MALIKGNKANSQKHRKLRKVLLILEIICYVLIACFILQIAISRKRNVEINQAEESYRKVDDESVEFPYVGTAGSVALSYGYTVALDYGDVYDTGEGGQGIVDQDYKALLGDHYFTGDTGEGTKDFKAILDHDYGLPPALPAIRKSDYLWIKDEKGTITKYKKIRSVHTLNRETDDIKMSDGTNAFNAQYIDSFTSRDSLLIFMVCEDDGRNISYWQPV